MLQGRHVSTVLQELREKNKGDLGRVVDILMCHAHSVQCAHGVVALLEQTERHHWSIIDLYLPILQELSALVGSKGAPVSPICPLCEKETRTLTSPHNNQAQLLCLSNAAIS